MSVDKGQQGERVIDRIRSLSIPAGWQRVTISTVGDVRLGRQRSPKNRSASFPTKYIRAANITWDGLSLDDVLDMEFRPDELSAYRLEPGDVLLSEASGSPKEVGKSAIWGGEINDCCFQNTVIRFRPKQVISKFALVAFQHFARNGIFSEVSKGVGIHHLSADRFATMPFLLPPLPEQRRIVSKIEELFSDLDAGVAALQRAKANLKRYRAAVLKAAVEGHLTADWRAEQAARAKRSRTANTSPETASQLLDRILTERRQKWEAAQLAKFAATGKTPPKDWQSKYPAPTPPDTKDLPSLPEGWCWASVEQLGLVQLGRQRSPKNRSDKYPTKYIRAANLTETGLDLSDVMDMDFHPKELETYRLEAGDILLSEASGSPDQVGKPVIWRGEIENCCFQNTVIRLRPHGIPSEYPFTVFRHYYVNKLFAKVSAGVGINHLSAAKFSALPFPLAPLDEQAKIASEVEELLSVIAVSERQIQFNLTRATRLRQSILKRAFEGKLVPQDPTDEPVSSEILNKLTRVKQIATPPRTRRTESARYADLGTPMNTEWTSPGIVGAGYGLEDFGELGG